MANLNFWYSSFSLQLNTVVCDSWFLHTRYTSFQHQLNVNGFQRITKGPDKNAYYGKNFVRGHPNLANKMKRFINKHTFVRRPGNPETEPNFYVIRFLPTYEQPTKSPDCTPAVEIHRTARSTSVVADFEE
jgi:HSF-type DNA-binding